MITEKDFNRLKLIVKKEGKIKVYSSNDDELNRKVMEKLPVEVLLINLSERKDFSKQRDSGFNQVMAKIAKKNKVEVGINLDELILSKEKNRILARLMQNIQICKKEKLGMQFIQMENKRSLHELKSVLESLGAPTWMSAKLREIFE